MYSTAFQESFDDAGDLVGSIFKAIMPRSRYAVHIRIREQRGEQRQENICMQRLVRVAPDCQRRSGPDRRNRCCVGLFELMRAGRKALGPTYGSQAIAWCGEVRAVGGNPRVADHIVIFEAVDFHGAEDIEAELTQYLLQTAVTIGLHDPLEPGCDGGISQQALQSVGLPERRRSVGGNDALDAPGMARGQAHADGTAEIVHDQAYVFQVQLKNELLEIVDVILQPIVAVLRRLALAEAHVIGNHYPVVVTKRRDQGTEQIAPRRLAVQAQDNFSRAVSFVCIVHLKSIDHLEMRGKWKRLVKICVCQNQVFLLIVDDKNREQGM